MTDWSNVTDRQSRAILEGQAGRLASSSCETTLLKEAEEARHCDDQGNIRKAAYTYVALARFARDKERWNEAGKYFHFAGHQLRRLQEYQRSANAYLDSGKALEQYLETLSGQTDEKKRTLDFLIRSYARAKTTFADVGESDSSESAYLREQDSRLCRARLDGGLRHFGLLISKRTTRYGTSVPRWMTTTAIVMLIFYTLNFWQISTGGVVFQNACSTEQGNIFSTLVTPLYFTVVTLTTVGYGDLVPVQALARLIVMGNIFFGYFVLALGASIMFRKVKGL